MKDKLWTGPRSGVTVLRDIPEDETVSYEPYEPDYYKPGDLDDVTIRRWGSRPPQVRIYRAGWPSKYAARVGRWWVWIGPYVIGRQE